MELFKLLKNIGYFFILFVYAYMGIIIFERTDCMLLEYFGVPVWFFLLGIILGLDSVNWKVFHINRLRLLTLVLPMFLIISYIYIDFGLLIATEGKIDIFVPLPLVFKVIRSSPYASYILFTALGKFLISTLFAEKHQQIK